MNTDITRWGRRLVTVVALTLMAAAANTVVAGPASASGISGLDTIEDSSDVNSDPDNEGTWPYHRRVDVDAWTVERHLTGRPAGVVALYHRFVELAEACGPFTYAVAKTAITLKGSRRGFAGASLGGTWLEGYLDLQRQLEDPRIRRSTPYTRRLFVNRYRVVSLGELDDDFAGWLAEAYEVGQGGHLASPEAR